MKKIALFLAMILAFTLLAQENEKVLKEIKKQLESGSKSVSDVLSDPAYLKFHSLSSFRELIRDHAVPGKIILVNKNEPGSAATIRGKITGNTDVADLLIYVYQTDNKGWYADTAPHVLIREGDRGHARLFGYLRTDKEGGLEFSTIHPQGYPRSSLPQHIHLEIYDKQGNNVLGTELLFDDDPRLQGDARQRALQDGFIIAKNESKGAPQLYSYIIQLR